MTLFLDNHCGYDAEPFINHIDVNTFGMVPKWCYGILREYINC